MLLLLLVLLLLLLLLSVHGKFCAAAGPAVPWVVAALAVETGYQMPVAQVAPACGWSSLS